MILFRKREGDQEIPQFSGYQLDEIPLIKELLERTPGDGCALISVVGGGGKTSLIYRLAELLGYRGFSVGITTTTKMETNHPLSDVVTQWVVGNAPHGRSLFSHDNDGLCITQFARSTGNDKLLGFSGETLDILKQDSPFDIIFVEADGSAGAPVKCPGTDEPVIPKSSDGVIVVFGLSSLGKTPSDQWIHRFERYKCFPNIDISKPISVDTYSTLVRSTEGLLRDVSEHTPFAVLCNQFDEVLESNQPSLVALLRERGYYEVSLDPKIRKE